MSIASLSFAASLPTYNSVGSNGTVFANNTLAATGDVLVNTNDKSTNGVPSVLAADFSANGLSYTFQSYSISGNTLSVIYGLSDNAGSDQLAQASDQNAALSGGIPNNVTDFTATGSTNTGSALTTNSYTAQTEGVGTSVPTGHGSAISSVTSSGGEGVSLASISAGGNNTVAVTFTLSPPGESAVASSVSTQVPNTGAIPPPSNKPSIVSLLSGLPPPAGKNVIGAVGIGLTAQSNSVTAASINPGALLANFLNPSINQPASIYSLIANIGIPQPVNQVNLVA
jgi:hypothetical protein